MVLARSRRTLVVLLVALSLLGLSGGRFGGTTVVAQGASFDGHELAAVPVESVIDTTGAGDAFAAGWLVGGPKLALEAGARCVQLAGSMPESAG